MAKLWFKNYDLNELLEKFTVGNDYILDKNLVVSDCLCTIAHIQMLSSIGILTKAEFKALKAVLLEIIKLDREGKFEIKMSDEDCHTAIEGYLTAKLGDAGKKVHTGRSRNDQVLTATRFFAKARILDIMDKALGLVDSLSAFAEKYKNVPMPGRTHMQIAMPSSVGLWGAAFAEELLDDIAFLKSAYDLNNRCPLGSAASYGVPLPLDRELTASLLGFGGIQNNVLYANNSRGKIESMIADALEQLTLTYSKMAQDLIIFSMPEFGYFSLPASLCSGSSIMPQKKNPDGLELLRGKAASLSGYCAGMKNVVRALPTGYNRDFQETKELFIKILDTADISTQVAKLTIDELKVNKEKLKAGFTPDIFATDEALRLVASGKSFRDAYKEVGLNLDKLKNEDPASSLKKRTSTGTPGNLNLKYAKKAAASLRDFAMGEHTLLLDAIKKLTGKKILL
ncbi:MAG: argininosuccinate lyase [Spirochaetia bacterium]|nr:argininosuccinate lyase [Spirochaetia bacterium]MBQ3647914.1 argininosuccinate lyase [Spirochaetia bacterium]MBQ3712905.1 argininosuccinate lyase [Spirochaetia bacterium]MBQ6673943.1 argininosuccinate lyase [Spirochaetia bacterium]